MIFLGTLMNARTRISNLSRSRKNVGDFIRVSELSNILEPSLISRGINTAIPHTKSSERI